jgi:hypothetical protein
MGPGCLERARNAKKAFKGALSEKQDFSVSYINDMEKVDAPAGGFLY